MNEGKNLASASPGNVELCSSDLGSQPSEQGRSLCAPDWRRSCFGCCPPIRPAHYDPLDWVSSLKREFRENRESFCKNRRLGKPIVGFSCWALGYLDSEGLRIGCLLHPGRHAGQDLRHLTGYGEKCARECCLQAKHFQRLTPQAQAFWLGLTEGLGSFFYSSRRANPLFHLLLWGPTVLEKLAALGQTHSLPVTELVHRYPFLAHERWNPRGHRFLMEFLFLGTEDDVILEDRKIEETAQRIHEALCREIFGLSAAMRRPPLAYVHRCGLSDAFADYLRGIHGIFEANTQALSRLLERAHREAQLLGKSRP